MRLCHGLTKNPIKKIIARKFLHRPEQNFPPSVTFPVFYDGTAKKYHKSTPQLLDILIDDILQPLLFAACLFWFAVGNCECPQIFQHEFSVFEILSLAIIE